jgi:AcrR family transcriptional regulator
MATVKRPYSSDLRAEQARRTRWQIVSAASELFQEFGYAGTTIEAVAERAGVSRKTVFTSVGNKVELLHLAYDYAMGGDDQPLTMLERPELQAIIATENPWEQLRMFGTFVADVHSRVSRLWLALRSAAEVDEAAHELYTRWETERRLAMLRGPVPVMIEKGVLRDGLDAERAADLLWTFNDPALYDRLVNRAGWTKEQYTAWLHELIPAQVLVPEPTH